MEVILYKIIVVIYNGVALVDNALEPLLATDHNLVETDRFLTGASFLIKNIYLHIFSSNFSNS